jgi:hypothetical protein
VDTGSEGRRSSGRSSDGGVIIEPYNGEGAGVSVLEAGNRGVADGRMISA